MRFLVILILFLLQGIYAVAQTAKPIKWTFSLSKNEVKKGESLEIIMKAEIKPNWYLYSSDFDPNLGPTVTSILFDVDDSYKVVSQLKPIGAKEKYDSLWEGKVRYFTTIAEFRQELQFLRPNPVVRARIYYQVCSDKEGKCIPYEENIYFDDISVLPAAVISNDQQKKNEIIVVEKKKTDTVFIIKNSADTKPSSNLSELESEKEKLIQKDSKGNDIAVEQLKAFTKKYGGGK